MHTAVRSDSLFSSVASFRGGLVITDDLAGVQAAVAGKDEAYHGHPGEHIQVRTAEHLHAQ